MKIAKTFFVLIAVAFIGATYMIGGCAGGFSATQKDCVGPVDTRKKAVALAGPHVVSASMCAAMSDTSDEAKACVANEFEALKAKSTPAVYQCALTLFSDVVAAAQ